MTPATNPTDSLPAGAPDPALPVRGGKAPFPGARGSETPEAHEVGSVGAPFRIGEGWDTHALVPGRKLIIGGVTVPHSTGLLGHSDADLLIHAIIDALLGAAGLGDIGSHFPDTDARFKGADSVVLLRETGRLLAERGLRIGNIDSTVIAQAPKLAPHIPAMRQCLADALGLDLSRVNVKAKTAEKLGPVGQGLSMEARAVALLF
ncbi:2-C-methyl-D-erythritol 2,4-cyclodiphosphate synthase [Polaromonas eurypsychrophila]|uniref:2-C-methyl-D-erythritol 2,4-cyclodiphosphate synthase n=1 Tax=Polaromonas eurypsychrophila TaxID=1614635 RepID=A0A916SSH2_9BURK|nr:2-C-methyl-D-erythritol 2,4-cyclodiphosphate synthase [Polaromonas eurypsychrophila]